MDEKSEQKTPSNALREWIRRARADCHMSLRELDAIADHMDSEFVELPRDSDGVPIHVGDTVYLDDGSKAYVERICIMANTTHVECAFSDGRIIEFQPTELTHTRPDSFERIADEIERYANDSRSEDEIDGQHAR